MSQVASDGSSAIFIFQIRGSGFSLTSGMSIWHRSDTQGFPSLITTNLEGRRRLFLSADAACLFIQTSQDLRCEGHLLLLGFVVMPDHVHLVVTPASGQRISKTAQLVKGRFSHRFNQQTGSSGALWQSRYHERTLFTEEALSAAMEYVHQNPVAAGMVADAAQYPWSSANGRYPTDLEAFLGSG